VLWVVNTVARCQEIARQFNALCYHSRFKVIDRKNIHKCVIEIFRKDSTEPVIVITTQVCEMSLDLNADVLITELAPIASMSQRMGRCNRFAHIFRDGRLGQVYVYYPPNYPQKTNPYEKLDFQGAEQFVDDLNGKIVSQYDLQELLEKYSANRPVPLQSLSLWESGPWAYPQSLRDISQTVPALMPEDVELYKLLKSQKRHANELLIPALGYTIEVKDKLAIVKQQYSYSPKYGLS
jgi:CRISPR-associated endonuclease/helicase Cas3